MKKVFLLAAIVISCVACKDNLNDEVKNNGKILFHKGEKATLVVSSSEQGKNIPSRNVNGNLDAQTQNVYFEWQTGDKVTVSVQGGGSAEFTLKTGAGTNSATFEGTWPSDGANIKVSYDGTNSTLYGTTNQIYKANALPNNAIRAYSGDYQEYDSNKPFLLKASPVVRINLYGTNKIRAISVLYNNYKSTATVYSPTDSIVIGTTEATATPFFIVLPSEVDFTSALYVNIAGTYQYTYSTTSNKTLSMGKILNLSAKECSGKQIIYGSPDGIRHYCYTYGYTTWNAEAGDVGFLGADTMYVGRGIRLTATTPSKTTPCETYTYTDDDDNYGKGYFSNLYKLNVGDTVVRIQYKWINRNDSVTANWKITELNNDPSTFSYSRYATANGPDMWTLIKEQFEPTVEEYLNGWLKPTNPKYHSPSERFLTPIRKPNLTTQTYKADGIPEGKMTYMTDTATWNNPAYNTPGYYAYDLYAQDAVLKLMLSDRELTYVGVVQQKTITQPEIAKVVVTNLLDNKTYTLDCTNEYPKVPHETGFDDYNFPPLTLYTIMPAGLYPIKVEVYKKAAGDPVLYKTFYSDGYVNFRKSTIMKAYVQYNSSGITETAHMKTY